MQIHKSSTRINPSTCFGDKLPSAGRNITKAKEDGRPEKLTSPQLVKKLPAFYETQWFSTAFTTARHLTILRQIDSVRAPLSHLSKIKMWVLLTTLC